MSHAGTSRRFRIRAIGLAALAAVGLTAVPACGGGTGDEMSTSDAAGVEVAGIRVRALATAAEEPTSKPRVLLLHGAAYDADVWTRTGTVDALRAAGIDSVAIDLPGFGQTPPLDESTEASPPSQADFMAALAASVRAGRAFGLDADPSSLTVVSPSMSGQFSFAWLGSGTADVQGYVFVAPVGAGSFRPPTADALPSVLSVVGADDQNFSTADAAALAEMFPNGESLTIPAAGHAAYEDQPQTFNDALVTFVTNL